MNRRRKRRVLLLLGLPVLVLCLSTLLLWWETSALAVEQVEVQLVDLPPELDGLRIAQISDLHGRRIAPDGRLVQAIQQAQVDLIAVTGDLIDHEASELNNVLPLLQQLVQLSPTYAVSGNHDYNTNWPDLARQLRQIGVTVLENSHLILEKDGTEYCLAGVADHFSGHADLEQALPRASWNGLTILLSHSPTLFEWDWPRDYLGSGSRDWPERQELLQRVDLTLSGHTHGGQIKLPLIGAVTRGTADFFPKHHVQGLSAEFGGWLYINRGLGTTGIVRARFLSRPELTILTLKRAE